MIWIMLFIIAVFTLILYFRLEKVDVQPLKALLKDFDKELKRIDNNYRNMLKILKELNNE